jgi:hypothetical protein
MTYAGRTFEMELRLEKETPRKFFYILEIPGIAAMRTRFEYFKEPERADQKEATLTAKRIATREGVPIRRQVELHLLRARIAWERKNEGFSLKIEGVPNIDRREDADRQADVDAVETCLNYTAKFPPDVFLPPRRLQTRELFKKLATVLSPKRPPMWQRHVLENWVKDGLWQKSWTDVAGILNRQFPSYYASVDTWKKRLGKRSAFGLTAGGERL